MSDQVTKIYELKTLGYGQVKTELDGVAQGFRDIKTAKREAEAEAKKSASSTKTETDAIIQQKEAITALKLEEQKLKVERQQLLNEAKALQVARQQEINQQRQQKASTEAVAGSYNALYKQYKELYALVKAAPKGADVSFQGQTLGFDQAKTKLQELAAAEQDFRRQFSRDSLLVGEYTSGIVQAFKQMGLDDLIGGQVTKANERLQMLDNEFKELKTTLSQVAVNGDGSLEEIEKQLIENRKEAIALQQQVGNLEQELKSTGDVGSRITSAIGKGFKDLKGQVGQFALSFVGIQALFNKVQQEATEAIKAAKEIEGVKAAFEKLNDIGLLDNLRKATRGTVSDLELMKVAVQANNFQIPLDTLGNLLDFARRRAKDTGQEVDYLVQSIITGIGRKSPLILDNLGISAVRLKDNLKGVTAESASIGDVAGAVAKIISEENEKAGVDIESNTEKIGQLSARWENLRAELGQKLLPILTALGAALLFLASNLSLTIPLIITIIGLTNTWAGSILRLAGAFLLEKAALVIERAQMIANNTVRIIATTLTNIYSAALIRSATATGAAAVAARVLAATITFLTSPLGIAVGLIIAFTTAIGILSASASKASTDVSALAESQRNLASQQRINEEISKRVAEATGEQIARIRQLEKITTDTGISEQTRRKALDELIRISPKYREALSKEGIEIGKVRSISDELVNSLRQQAKARAVAQLATEKEKRREEIESKLAVLGPAKAGSEKGAGAFFQNLAAGIGLGDGTVGQQRRELLNELGDVETDLKTIYSRVEKNAELQTAIIDTAGGGGNNDNGKGNGDKATKTVSDKQAQALKLIEARLNEQLAIQKLSFIKQEINEEQYLKNVLDLNKTATQEKLTIIKGANLEELEAIAEIKVKQTQLEQDTNDQIYSIREKGIEDRFEQSKKEIEAQLRDVKENPLATEQAKIDAQLKADKELLALQVTFNSDMDALEKDYNKASAENAFERAEAIKSINRQLTQDQIDQLKNDSKLIEQEGKDAIAKFQATIAESRLKLQGKSKDKGNQELDKAETRGVLGIEVATLQKLLPLYKQQLDAKIITDEEYYKHVQELNTKVRELNNSTEEEVDATTEKIKTLGQLIQSGLRSLFKTKEGSELDGLIGNVVAQSYDLAKNAMNAYFDAEIERINQSKAAQIERLELEKNQQLSRAQSRDEELAIEQQFQAKKALEEQKAGERIKKLKKAEAKIALASELANLAVAAAQNPLNGVTLGAAGIAMYSLLAALAIGRYAMRVNDINKTQFEYGGQVPTDTGGKITGPSHAGGGVPFNYEAEGGELAIIRTKNAPQGRKFTISGTHAQIASQLNQLGGGRPFASGAKYKAFEYGGSLGESLQAPLFTPASNTLAIGQGESIDRVLDLLTEQAKATQAVNSRIDRLQVYQVTSSVTKAQKKQVIQDEIGTL